MSTNVPLKQEGIPETIPAKVLHKIPDRQVFREFDSNQSVQ